MVTILWTVTIQLQPFLLGLNFALKSPYQAVIWLRNVVVQNNEITLELILVANYFSLPPIYLDSLDS